MEGFITATHRLIRGRGRPDVVEFFTRMLQEYNGYRVSHFSSDFLQACENAHMYWDDGVKMNLAAAHLEPVAGKADLTNPQGETMHWPPWIVSPEANTSVMTGRSLPQQSRWHARFHQYGGGKDQGLIQTTRAAVEHARNLSQKMVNVYKAALARSTSNAVKYPTETLRANYQTFLKSLHSDAKSTLEWHALLSEWLRSWDAMPWATLDMNATVPYSRDHLIWAASFVDARPDATHLARCVEDASIGIYNNVDLKNMLHAARNHPESIMTMWCLLKTIESIGDVARALTHNMANTFSDAVTPRSEHGFVGTRIAPSNGAIRLQRLPINAQGMLASGDRQVYAREAAAAASLLVKMQQEGHSFAVDMRRARAHPELWREGRTAPKPTDIDPQAAKEIPDDAWLPWARRYNARRVALAILDAFRPERDDKETLWENDAARSTIYVSPNIGRCVQALVKQLDDVEDTIYTFASLHKDIVNARSIQQNVWTWAANRVWKHPCWEGMTWLNASIMAPMRAVFITGCQARDASDKALRFHARVQRSITEDESLEEQDLIEIREEEEERLPSPPRQEEEEEPRAIVSPIEWVVGLESIYNRIVDQRGWPVRCAFLAWWAEVEVDFQDPTSVLLAVGQCIAWAALAVARAPDTVNMARHAELLAGASPASLFDDSIKEILAFGLSCYEEGNVPNPDAEAMIMTQIRLSPLGTRAPDSPIDAIPLISDLAEAGDVYLSPWVSFLKSMPFPKSQTYTVPVWPPFRADEEQAGANLLTLAMQQRKRMAPQYPEGAPPSKRRQFEPIQGLFSMWEELPVVAVGALSVFATVFLYILSRASTPIKATLPIVQNLAQIMPDGSAWQLFTLAARNRGQILLPHDVGDFNLVEFTDRAADTFTAWNSDVLDKTSSEWGIPGMGPVESFLFTTMGIFSAIDTALFMWYAISKFRMLSARKARDEAQKEFDAVMPLVRADDGVLRPEQQRAIETLGLQFRLCRDREHAHAFWRRILIEDNTYRYIAQGCVGIRASRHVSRMLMSLYRYSDSPLMMAFTTRVSSQYLHGTLVESLVPTFTHLLGGVGVAGILGRALAPQRSLATGAVSASFIIAVFGALSQAPNEGVLLVTLISFLDVAVLALLAYGTLRSRRAPVNNNNAPVPPIDIDALVPSEETTAVLRMASISARTILRAVVPIPSQLDATL